jgi:hypothetical protein
MVSEQHVMPFAVTLKDNRIHLGPRFSVALQRTLRVPDDGAAYPLPPGLGDFPVQRIADYRDRLPDAWREREGFFIPMYQREALWLHFSAAWWKPNAVQVGVGGINAITGEAWDGALRDDPQNYMVVPDQPWLDGIRTTAGTVRQFVAVSLGAGDTVEEQLSGTVTTGGIQVDALEPKPGLFPDEPPRGQLPPDAVYAEAIDTGEMGVAAGGEIAQKIYPDEHGLATWDEASRTGTVIYLLNSSQYQAVTGQEPPPTPITPELYTKLGFPWFSLWDEERRDLPPSERLQEVQSLREREKARDETGDEPPLVIDPGQIIELKPKPEEDATPRATDAPENDHRRRR